MGNGLSWSALVILLGALLAAVGAWWPEAQQHRLKRRLFGLLGAILVAGGVFWSSIERASYEHRISELSQEIMSQTTGGESYCYVKAGPVDLNPKRFWVLSVWHVGEYPCFDVTIQIKDVDQFKQATRSGKAKSLRDIASIPTVNIGTIPPKSIVPIFKELDLSGFDRRRFSFVISLRNGWAFQKLQLRKIKGTWKRAIEVRVKLTRKPLQVFEEVDPEFPRSAAGKVDW